MRTRGATIVLLMTLLAGCAKPPDERSATVSGTVTLAGEPVSAGTVLFMTETGHAATAELSAEGVYTLRCRPDHYKVSVTPPPPLDPLVSGATAAKAPPSGKPIPTKYHDFGASGLTVETKPGANKFDITLTP